MLIHKLLLLSCLCFIGAAYTQNYSSSPFSSQGLGEEGALNDGQFSALGNVKAAVIDSNVVNTFNPSSYAFLSKGQPLLGIGLSSRMSWYSYDGGKTNGAVVGLTQISLVLPLKSRLGIAFSLQPFSRKGYSLGSKDVFTDDSVSYTFIGSGSTNQVLGGVSYKFIKTKRQEFAVGGNLGYVFGSVTNERRAVFTSLDPEGGVDLTSYRINSVHYDFGMSYRLKFDDQGRNQFTLGAMLTPEQVMQANLDYGLFYATDVADQTSFDTLSFVTDDKGNIRYPQSATIGFNYAFRPWDKEAKLKSIYQISVYGDYTMTQWSRFQTNFDQHTAALDYSDSRKLSFGIQYTPSFEFVSRAAGSNIFSGLRYRAGAYTASLPNMQNGLQVKEKAVSLGVGIPFASLKSNTVFNVGIQYGSRGTGAADALSEKFLSVNFGIVLAPSPYERWFKKYKLD